MAQPAAAECELRPAGTDWTLVVPSGAVCTLQYGFDAPVRRSGPTSKWLSMRLDAIYTRGMSLEQFAVLRDVRSSDHYPLWAELSESELSRIKSSKSPVRSSARQAPVRNRHTIRTASNTR